MVSKVEHYSIIALILLIVGGGLWEIHRESADNLARMQGTISTIEGERRDAQQTLVTQLAAIAQEKRATVTPAQVIRELPSVINLPAPIVAVQPATSQAVAALPDKPTPNRDAIIPAADLKPLFDRLSDCKACEAQREAQTVTISQLQKERDAAVQAAKGGSFWRRLKHDAKVIGISVAIGAAVGYAAHR